ncbi:polysaccharide pyruvyl transferase family protein [Vibrio sp. F13]|nr:polysaccharide pyruvyl transferase family protein [Vibrio sp. F13]
MHRMLSVKGVDISSNYYKFNPGLASEINDNYDAFVVPLANAFRKSFIEQLDEMTTLIQRLNIPVIVVGVGVQATLDYNTDALKPYTKSIYNFVTAVLDKSNTIGVRGECTYNFLVNIGIPKDRIDIIGCPSMFLDGANLSITKKKEHLDKESKVAINISPYAKKILDIAEHNRNLIDDLTYIPQNNDSLKRLIWGGNPINPKLPDDITHPMYMNDKVRFFVDPTTWIDHLKAYDFVFGTRIHGTIMGILAGTPSYLLAHDSRTLELAEYFEIPHKRIDAIKSTCNAFDLYQEADYSKMLSGHIDRFDRFTSFIEKNGLKHVYQSGEDHGAQFDTRIATSVFPREVTTPYGANNFEIISRIQFLHQENKRNIALSNKTIKTLKKLTPKPIIRALRSLKDI